MTNEQKIVLDNYVSNTETDKEFNLVLEKLNEFLTPFFENIMKEYNNEMFFKLNLIGEYCLNSYFNFDTPIHILIETFYANEEDLNYSNSRENKSDWSKLIIDGYNLKRNLLLVGDDLVNALFKYIVLKGNNIKVFKRKNCVYIKYLDYKFVLFFATKNQNNSEYNFTVKGINYNFNLKLLNEKLLEKNKETKGNFFKLVKFYKAIEKELIMLDRIKIEPSRNLYFYENLLYNIPNKLLKNNNVYDNFIESYNFLNDLIKTKKLDTLTSPDDFMLIDDNFELFAKNYITSYDIKNLIKQTKIFIDNVENIVNPK